MKITASVLPQIRAPKQTRNVAFHASDIQVKKTKGGAINVSALSNLGDWFNIHMSQAEADKLIELLKEQL